MLIGRRNGLQAGSRRLFSTSSRRHSEKPVMNRYSRTVTQPKTQGASQAMLYATEGVNNDEDFNKAMVGVASVWYVLLACFTTRLQCCLGTKAIRTSALRLTVTDTNLCPFIRSDATAIC